MYAQFHVDWDVQTKCAWIHACAHIDTSGYFCTLEGHFGLSVLHVSVGNPCKSLYMRPKEKMIHAFIFSRLDYCNLLYVGLDQRSLKSLQLVQNAAAWLLTGTKKRVHTTPVLAFLHWLPDRFRIDFKIRMFVFKILNGFAPEYLADLIHVHRPIRALRSANKLYLDVPKCKIKTKGN